MFLKRIGLRNFHPRFYRSSLSAYRIEWDNSEHLWVHVGRLVFTTQPRGDGTWDKIWNFVDR